MPLLERLKLAQMCWALAGEIDPLVRVRAKALMQEINDKSLSGEWKRHQVYAQLLKEFPHRSRKSIAYTIEVIKCCG